MASIITQITPNNQKEAQPGSKVEIFGDGTHKIEVVYPSNWNSAQPTIVPNSAVSQSTPPANKVDHSRTIEQIRDFLEAAKQSAKPIAVKDIINNQTEKLEKAA